MEFRSLEKCPFCGCDEFYTIDYYQGSSVYYQRFDGKEAYDNSQMYEGLLHKQGAKAFCANCDSYLGNVNAGKVGKKAERALKEKE